MPFEVTPFFPYLTRYTADCATGEGGGTVAGAGELVTRRRSATQTPAISRAKSRYKIQHKETRPEHESTRSVSALNRCKPGARLPSARLTDRAATCEKIVFAFVRLGARADDDHKDHGQHDCVLRDVLSLLILQSLKKLSHRRSP